MLGMCRFFYALGRKSDKKTGLSSSHDLGKSSSPKSPAIPSYETMWDEKFHENSSQIPERIQQCWKGMFISIPIWVATSWEGQIDTFAFSLDKPHAWPAPHKPHSLASHQSTVASPAQSCFSNIAQPTAVNSSQPAPAYLTGHVGPS